MRSGEALGDDSWHGVGVGVRDCWVRHACRFNIWCHHNPFVVSISVQGKAHIGMENGAESRAVFTALIEFLYPHAILPPKHLRLLHSR